MKNIVYITIMLCMSVTVTKAEEPYWEKIKEYIIAYDKAEGIPENDRISKEFTEYLDSLTAEQLIEAGRQCSDEGNASFQKNGFAEGTGFVISFFIGYYPKTAGLGDLRPIFRDIEDTNQTDMWRSTLIHAFGVDWSQKLSDNQLREVINNIDKILERKNVYYRVVNEALYTTKATLGEIENRNMKNVSSVNDANDANKGNQEKKSQEITEYYTRFLNRLINISGEPNLNPELQRVSFALLRDLLDKPSENRAEVENTLINAVRNYEKYDVKTWRLLAQIGIEKLQMPDGEQIAKSMADKLELKMKNETDDHIKVPLQSELKSIKRCLKKEAERKKQSLPDPNVETR
ncbi:MAG: hypothetical protein PHY02_07645 [Phycisphaerae bacterium]|nr:hypothetical protein [Phycisphaerae bacterium]